MYEVFIMNFITFDRSQSKVNPNTLLERSDDKHLVKFIELIVSILDLSCFINQYKGRGKSAYPPSMLLSLLLYSYATGVTSARQIWRNTEEVAPYIYICCGSRPHHSTISVFRKRFDSKTDSLFNQLLDFFAELGLLKSNACYVDGAQIKANVSKHPTFSHKRAVELKTKYEQEIKELKEMSRQDCQDPSKVDVLDEIKFRENKLVVLNHAIDATRT
jgi:transposase